MNTKKNLPKPKANAKIANSPDPHLKTPITTANSLLNQQQFMSPVSRGRAEAVKKSLPPREPVLAKVKSIPEAQVLSNSDSQLQGSEIEKQELLQLQIKHLKRENTFLKKKLQELTAEQQTYYPKKKTAPKTKGYQAPDIESLHLNVKHFFKEINNLLSSIAKLFKLNLNEEENPINIKALQVDNEQCPLQREFLFKKYLLNRKLEKIALEDEEKRYPSLLEIFTEYYRYKEEAEHKILQNLDTMIIKTNELNKWLLEKAQIKRLKSEVYSRSHKESIASPEKGFTFQFLKIPDSHTNRMTFSPNPKHNPYKRSSDLSP